VGDHGDVGFRVRRQALKEHACLIFHSFLVSFCRFQK
jgi:hypothetical protein